MTKGQRAIAVAMIYPEPVKTKRSGSVKITDLGVSTGAVSMARTVLKYSKEHDLVDEVMSGALRLDKAYEKAQGGRGKKAAINGEVSGVAHQRVSDARAVPSPHDLARSQFQHDA